MAMHVPHPADRPKGTLHPEILEELLDFVHLLIHGGNLRETNHKKSGGRGQRLETEAGNSSVALRQSLSLGFPTGRPGGGVTVPLFFFFSSFLRVDGEAILLQKRLIETLEGRMGTIFLISCLHLSFLY